jgi:hypothetical protein
MTTENTNWDSLVDRLVLSLETSRKTETRITQENNAEANKQLRERILLNAGRANKPKRKSMIDGELF